MWSLNYSFCVEEEGGGFLNKCNQKVPNMEFFKV